MLHLIALISPGERFHLIYQTPNSSEPITKISKPDHKLTSKIELLTHFLSRQQTRRLSLVKASEQYKVCQNACSVLTVCSFSSVECRYIQGGPLDWSASCITVECMWSLGNFFTPIGGPLCTYSHKYLSIQRTHQIGRDVFLSDIYPSSFLSFQSNTLHYRRRVPPNLISPFQISDLQLLFPLKGGMHIWHPHDC